MLKEPINGDRDRVYWHVLQTYSAAEVAFNRYIQLFPRDSWSYLWAKKPNESEKTIFLTGNRQVHFKSGDNFEDLRVETLAGVIIDECRQQDPRLWRMVIRPMLGRYKGWAQLLSTPNGYDWFYDTYQEGLSNPEEWECFHSPSSECFWWTKEELESAKRSMSDAEYSQEILAEFRDLAQGKAYINFGEHNKQTQHPFCRNGETFNAHLPIYVGLDFNLNPMAWTLAQKKINHMHFFDEIFLGSSHTPEAAEVLAQKAKGHKPGVILVGDATGRAGQRAAAGQSDYDILCQILDKHGVPWVNLTPESNPLVKDRVNTVNARLKSASGEVFVTVNPQTCPHLVKDWERVVWKQSSSSLILDQKTDPMLTHMSDGAGYLICQTLPIDSASQQVGKLSVILR